MKSRDEIETRIEVIEELKLTYGEQYKKKMIKRKDLDELHLICRVVIKELKWVLDKEDK